MVEQPYQYRRRELAEPDWRRLPGWSGVTRDEWESAQWQRAHSVKNARQLREVTGGGLSEAFLADLERDHRRLVRRPGAPLHAAGLQRPAA
jgi:hypothetical protein